MYKERHHQREIDRSDLEEQLKEYANVNEKADVRIKNDINMNSNEWRNVISPPPPLSDSVATITEDLAQEGSKIITNITSDELIDVLKDHFSLSHCELDRVTYRGDSDKYECKFIFKEKGLWKKELFEDMTILPFERVIGGILLFLVFVVFSLGFVYLMTFPHF